MKKLFINRDNSSATVENLGEKFLLRKKTMNLSEETLIYYESCFRYFSDFYDVSLPCSSIVEDTFYEYISYLQDKGTMKPVTINSYLRGLRAILYFGMQEGYIDQFSVNLIKHEKTIKPTYTDEEILRLLEKPNIKTCDFQDYRNWVMINYLLATGNRLSSMINVAIEDVDFTNSVIIIRKTKNRRQLIIPLSQALSKVLNEYLEYRKGEKGDYLFCNLYGEQLTKSAVQCTIKKYNNSHGVDKTSVHVFRHTFAKKWILNGGDIFRLQKILGHSSLDIVKEYVNMFNADLQNNFEAFNPLDNMVKGSKSGKARMTMR